MPRPSQRVEKICVECGVHFSVKKSQAPKRERCGKACFAASQRKKLLANNPSHREDVRVKLRTRRGERSNFWKGGRAEWRHAVKESSEFKMWREKVLERDGHQCRKCRDDRSLNTHHIVNFTKMSVLNTTVSNGITLCRDCHRTFHSRYGLKNNSQEQIQEFLNLTNSPGAT